MSTLEIINLIAAIIVAAPLSIVIAQALKRSSWPGGVKAVLALAVCLGVGIAQTWIAGDLLGLIRSWGELTAADVIAWAGVVWAAAQIEYHAFFADSPWMLRLGEWPDRGLDD